MGKYAQGTVSPDGKYIVSGGKWVPYQQEAPAPQSTAGPVGYQTAETLNRDEQGRTLSFPHMAAPADMEGQAYSSGALALGLGGVSPSATMGLAKGAAGSYLGGKVTGALGLPPLLGELVGGGISPGRAILKAGLERLGVGAALGDALGLGAKEAAAGTAGAATETAATQASKATVRDYVKRMAPTGKWGEKIHVKLDPAGNPLDIITSDQAARLPGAMKDWVLRTW